jgi:hypothetical protein
MERFNPKEMLARTAGEVAERFAAAEQAALEHLPANVTRALLTISEVARRAVEVKQ